MNKRIVRLSLMLGILNPVVALLLTGCISMEPPLSTEAARQLTSKTYDAAFDKVFQSVVMSFQDSNYTITQSDKDSGLILANSERPCNSAGDMFIGRYSSRLEVTATVRKMGDNQQEVRLQFRTIDKFKDLRHSWEDIKTTRPDVYQKAFASIAVEVDKSK